MQMIQLPKLIQDLNLVTGALILLYQHVYFHLQKAVLKHNKLWIRAVKLIKQLKVIILASFRFLKSPSGVMTIINKEILCL